MKRVTRSFHSDDNHSHKRKKSQSLLNTEKHEIINIQEEEQDIIITDSNENGTDGVCTFCEFTYTELYKYRIHLLVKHVMDEEESDEEFVIPQKKGKEKDETYIYTRIDENDIRRALEREKHKQTYTTVE